MQLLKDVHRLILRRYLLGDDYPSWRTARAMFRIGDKYEMEDYKAAALKNILKAFPENLETWDKVQKTRHPDCMKIRSEEYISVANFAQDHIDIPMHVRWQALYQCCQLSDYRLMDGAPMPDGAQETLSAENLTMCLRGRRTLMWKDLEQTIDIGFTAPSESPDCTEACKAGQAVARLTIGDNIGWKNYDCNCLNDFRIIISRICRRSGICDACVERRVKEFHESRTKVLNELQLYFVDVS